MRRTAPDYPLYGQDRYYEQLGRLAEFLSQKPLLVFECGFCGVRHADLTRLLDCVASHLGGKLPLAREYMLREA